MIHDYPWILIVPLCAWFAYWCGRALWFVRSQSIGPGERTVTEAGWRVTR